MHLGLQLHLCNGSDGSQRLAAEAHGVDGKEVVGLVNLRGGVTFKADSGIAVAHAAAVVNHLYQRAAGILHYQLNLGGPSVQRILQQLLYGRGRPVHHLAGRNLIGHTIR